MTDTQKPRSGARIYRAASAANLKDTNFGAKKDYTECPEAEEVVTALATAARSAGRVLVNQRPEDGGFSLVYLYAKPNLPTLRHKHEDDCLYFIISGSASFGNQELYAGDSIFFPAFAPYAYTAGPDGAEILEIRHNVDGFTTIMTSNSASKLESVKAAIEKNGERWKEIATGPLLTARPRATGATSDP